MNNSIFTRLVTVVFISVWCVSLPIGMFGQGAPSTTEAPSPSEKLFNWLSTYSDPNKEYGYFTLSESALQKSEQDSPATLAYNHDDQLGSYTTVDFGFQLGYNWQFKDPADGYLGTSAIAEIHKNPLVKSHTDSRIYSLGINLNQKSLLVALNGGYKDDKVKTGKSMTDSIGVSWSEATIDLNEMDQYSKVPILWSPWIYGEEEDDNVINQAGARGINSRLHGALTLTWYPFWRFTDSANHESHDTAWDFKVTEEVWRSFVKTGTYAPNDENQSYFKVSTNYYLNSKKNVSLSLDFSNGEDPLLGKTSHRLFTIQLSLKFAKK